jgi:hypothetical protein
MRGIQHRLIPIFSDVIAPDPEMTALVDETRAPFEAEMSRLSAPPGRSCTGAAISTAPGMTSSATR